MAEMSKIEEVARAIWRARESQFPVRVQRPEPDKFDNASGAWDLMLDQARAAIGAMSEPNDAMVDAAGGELVPAGDFIPGYRAAIRAALSEEVAG